MLKINAEDYRIIVDSREQDLFNYKIFNNPEATLLQIQKEEAAASQSRISNIFEQSE